MAGDTPCIMLVDDDPDFVEINKHYLEAKGYRVLCAPGPRQALQKMAGERPDLVITDLMMNAADAGFSFSRQVKEDPRFKDIPVIILTGVSSRRGFDFVPRTPAELAAVRADAYFNKPVASEVLLAKVRELLGQPGAEDEP